MAVRVYCSTQEKDQSKLLRGLGRATGPCPFLSCLSTCRCRSPSRLDAHLAHPATAQRFTLIFSLFYLPSSASLYGDVYINFFPSLLLLYASPSLFISLCSSVFLAFYPHALITSYFCIASTARPGFVTVPKRGLQSHKRHFVYQQFYFTRKVVC